MGYCSYTKNAAGQMVAQWIGTGTDAGKSWTLTFSKGSAGFNSQKSACDAVRNAFCSKYGVKGKCYVPTTPPKIVSAPASSAGRCPAGYNNTTPNGPKATCVKRAGATLPGNAPAVIKPTTPSSSSSGGGGGSSSSSGVQNSYCKTNCDAMPFFGNLGCRWTKMTKGCGGNLGGPPLEGNPFGQSGTALDPKVKNAVCAKNCDQLDVFCKGAKIQAGCGGTDWTFWIIAGVAGIVGIVVLTRLLK